MVDSQKIYGSELLSKFDEVILTNNSNWSNKKSNLKKEIINLYELHLTNSLISCDAPLTDRLRLSSCSDKTDYSFLSTDSIWQDDPYFCKSLRNDFKNMSKPKSFHSTKDLLIPPLDFSKIFQACQSADHVVEKKRKSQPRRACNSSQNKLSPRTEGSLKEHINQLLRIDDVCYPRTSDNGKLDDDMKTKPLKLKRSKSRSPGKINIIEGYRFKHTESIIIPLRS